MKKILTLLFATIVALGTFAQDNLALNKTSIATSGDASLAIDGKYGTRWESAHEDPQTWQVDLGETTTFNVISIRWEGAYAKTFKIYGGNTVGEDGFITDGVELVSVEDQTLTGFPYIQNFKLSSPVNYRYVQFHGTARGTGYGYSFWEFGVYNLESLTLTTLEIASASTDVTVGEKAQFTVTAKDQLEGIISTPEGLTWSSSNPSVGAISNDGLFTAQSAGTTVITASADGVTSNEVTINVTAGEKINLFANWQYRIYRLGQATEDSKVGAFDDNDGSVWEMCGVTGADEASRTYDVGFIADLGAIYDVTNISIHFEGACSENFTLAFAGNDGVFGEPTYTGGTPGINNHTETFNGQTVTGARYVKFLSTKAATQWGVKIFDFSVYGTKTADVTDTEAPTITSAEASNVTDTGVTLNITATDNASKYIAYEINGVLYALGTNMAGQPASIAVPAENGSAEYTLRVVAIDAFGNRSAETLVEVNYVEPTSITLEAAANEVLEGNTLQITVKNQDGNPVSASKVAFATSDTGIASVDDNGLVTGVAAGPATITATLKTNTSVTAEISITVKASLAPKSNADEPTTPADKVIPIYSATYDKGLNENNPTWGIGGGAPTPLYTSIEEVTIVNDNEHNTVHVIGTGMNSRTKDAISLTPLYNKVHVAVYPLHATKCKIFDDNNYGSALEFEGLLPGQWNYVTINNVAFTKNYVCIELVGETEFYLDHFYFEKATELVPAPTPEQPAANVISIFSDAYTSATNYSWGRWNQSTVVTDETFGGDNMYYLTNFNYLGFDEFNPELGLSEMEYLHIDVYPMQAMTFGITPIMRGGTPTENSQPTVLGDDAVGQWNSIDIPLSQFGLDFSNNAYQLKIDRGSGKDALIVDNIYFYKTGETSITSLTVEPATVQVGSTVQLTVKDQNGAAVAADKVTFASSNDGIATVDTNGLVTGVAEGTATITATLKTDESISATAEITVTAAPSGGQVLVNGDHTVTIYGYHYLNQTENNYQLVITSDEEMNGLGGSYWHTSNGDVPLTDNITISEDRHTLTITTTSTTDPSLYTPLYVKMPNEVNFEQPTIEWIPIGEAVITELTIAPASSNVQVGSTAQLTVKDQNGAAVAADKVTFASSNDGIATVDTNGLVTGVAEGTATITATLLNTDESISATAEITVTAAPSGVTVIEKDGHTVTLLGYHYTNETTNNYELNIYSDDVMTALGGSFWRINENVNIELRTITTISSDRHHLTITASSTTKPDPYNELFISFGTETNFGFYTINWIPIGNKPSTTKTLAGLVNDGATDGYYRIEDLDLRFVQASNDGKTLYCKDNNNFANKSVAREDEIDYVKDVAKLQSGDWDQSNWVALRLEGDREWSTEYDGKKIVGLFATYTNATNPTLTVSTSLKPFGVTNAEEFTPNTYVTCNFEDDLVQEGNDGRKYFFVAPKPLEVANVNWAMWSDSDERFVVPPFYKDDNNVVNGYNLKGGFDANFSEYDGNYTLVNNSVYNFLGVIKFAEGTQQSAPQHAPASSSKVVYPVSGLEAIGSIVINDDGSGTITAIDDVTAGVAEVARYNAAGMRVGSDYRGLVIIRMSDGTARKVMVQ